LLVRGIANAARSQFPSPPINLSNVISTKTQSKAECCREKSIPNCHHTLRPLISGLGARKDKPVCSSPQTTTIRSFVISTRKTKRSRVLKGEIYFCFSNRMEMLSTIYSCCFWAFVPASPARFAAAPARRARRASLPFATLILAQKVWLE